jgi:hypothetical protein
MKWRVNVKRCLSVYPIRCNCCHHHRHKIIIR